VAAAATARLLGLEALVRWDHPDRGLVMPGEFVALAGDTGLIVPIGRWVLHAARQAARDWQRRFPLQPHPFPSVNLSVRQLQGFHFARPLDQFAVEALLVAEQARRPSPSPRLPVV
jgi:EAL domain-containing protein (putative c-di-GMP-specific phosphodiesterase class I)